MPLSRRRPSHGGRWADAYVLMLAYIEAAGGSLYARSDDVEITYSMTCFTLYAKQTRTTHVYVCNIY